MIRRILFPAIACALALPLAAPAAAAQAGEPAPPATEVAATAEAKPAPKVICRSQLAVGSLTKRTRSCRTASEWADLKTQTRQQIEKMQVVGAKY